MDKVKFQITSMITGSGRGIGKAIALKLAENNHKLILLVQKKNHKIELEKILKKKKINFSIYVGDLRNLKFLNSFKSKKIKVNNLINNSALPNTKHFLDVENKDIDDLNNVNLKSTFILSQIIAKKMIQNKIKGNVINITSQLGHIAAYNRSIYSMTKFGLEGLTKSMALDLGVYGIRVNAIAPTKTIVNQKERVKTKRLNKIRQKTALKKFSTTKQIAEIVLFLISKGAESITGTSILADAGWTAGK